METLRLSPPEMPGKKRPPMTLRATWVRLSSAMTEDTCQRQRSKVGRQILVQRSHLDAMGSFSCPHRADDEETPGRHLLPDGFGRVSLQGQLGCVGQSLLHRQITQQVVTLEGGNTSDIEVTTTAWRSSQLTLGSPACVLLRQLEKSRIFYFGGFGPLG